MNRQNLTISLQNVSVDKVNLIETLLKSVAKTMDFKVVKVIKDPSLDNVNNGLNELLSISGIVKDIIISDTDIKEARARRYE
ncbi:hypothetical protein CCAL9344_09075 [Campylobacter sp. RM9344]|uniref:Uncharacterized protein n=1 Tax=Campylobacter californiensis TaxID=1032243 RepID=A0AAW3ZWY3_9BACT|nr:MULTISPECIES: hypothetical protein [unclassified Campylobacter]MBE2985455.1 hypothetical protein [Campylobacter sp. RM6883]MBE2987250.1 hypothetical protein [Campylobacter sp. RM12919]MBE2989015.1 hypothetical protein [Campylobacter sp. RM12920]MBE2996023.1 hypothetical protein [Campylobacter sp. RM6913]MBE3030322.1 hypothetical protein [Campylobacter sp. RM9344]